MKPPAWFVNAARRTLLGLVPGLVSPDDGFAFRWLPGPEFRLYMDMVPAERHHACRVAREVLRRRPDASERLVRAALLHDVGKAGHPFRVSERILAHLLVPPPLPAAPPLRGLQRAWQLRLHHGHYGAQRIRAFGGDAEVADLVARHHHPGQDDEAVLLHLVDERT